MITTRNVLIALGIAVALYLAHRWASSSGQAYGPIKIMYDKIGQARDRFGVPYNQTNPGR